MLNSDVLNLSCVQNSWIQHFGICWMALKSIVRSITLISIDNLSLTFQFLFPIWRTILTVFVRLMSYNMNIFLLCTKLKGTTNSSDVLIIDIFLSTNLNDSNFEWFEFCVEWIQFKFGNVDVSFYSSIHCNTANFYSVSFLFEWN